MPGFINSMLNRKEDTARVYLPPDANTLLATMERVHQSTRTINLVIASKHPLPQWLSLTRRTSTSRRAPRSGSGRAPRSATRTSCSRAAARSRRSSCWRRPSCCAEHVPELRVRFVCVTDLFTLARPEAHPHGMDEKAFDELYTDDKPVIFNFHGYPSAIHQLIHRRPAQERFSVRGYAEEGTTTTPFELLAMNGVDRFQLAIDALLRADVEASEAVRGMSGAFAVALDRRDRGGDHRSSRRSARSCATTWSRRATTRRRYSTGRGTGRPRPRRPREARPRARVNAWHSVYITAMEPQSGKSVVALGLMELLSARTGSVGFFRPLVRSDGGPDTQIELIRDRYRPRSRGGGHVRADRRRGAGAPAAGDRDEVEKRVVAAYRDLERGFDVMVCEGTDFAGSAPALDFDLNAALANGLGCPVLAVVVATRRRRRRPRSGWPASRSRAGAASCSA